MNEHTQEQQGLPSRLIMLGLALGAASLSAGNQMITVFVIRFMTDDLAIAPAIAATIFAVVRIYDGFIDPYIGFASDRTKSRWGRRMPFLLVSTLLTPISLIGIFAIPQFGSAAVQIGWLSLMLVAHSTAYSLYAVPAAAMIVEATDDYHARSTILAWRTYGGFAGQLIGSTIPSWILAGWGAGRDGHTSMVLVVSSIVLVLGVASLPLLRNARATHQLKRHSASFLSQFSTAWKCKPFRVMILVHIVFMMGVATVMSSNALFTRYVLERTDAWLGTFYILMTAGNVISVPFWLRASRKFDKKKTYIVALALYGVGLASWYLSGPSEHIAILSLRVFLIGVAMGGVVLLAASMLTDAIRYDYVQSGERREGAFTGFMSLVDKFSNAAGIAAMGFALSVMGYIATSDGEEVVQGEGAVTAIMLCFCVFPALTALLSILLLKAYTIKEADLLDAPIGADPVPGMHSANTPDTIGLEDPDAPDIITAGDLQPKPGS